MSNVYENQDKSKLFLSNNWAPPFFLHNWNIHRVFRRCWSIVTTSSQLGSWNISFAVKFFFNQFFIVLSESKKNRKKLYGIIWRITMDNSYGTLSDKWPMVWFFGRRFMWTMEENTDFEHVCQTYMFTLQSITSH